MHYFLWLKSMNKPSNRFNLSYDLSFPGYQKYQHALFKSSCKLIYNQTQEVSLMIP